MRYLTILAFAVLCLYCWWLHTVTRHNDEVVADLTDQINELTQQRTSKEYRLSEYFKKEGYVLVFSNNGFTVSRRPQ